MSCTACDAAQKASEPRAAYFRWKNANVPLIGCPTHIGEIMQALTDALENSPPERGTVSAAEVHVLVNGFVASRTLEPAVDFAYGKIHMQSSAEKAREIGLMLIECAEAAMSDAFLVRFITEKTGAPVDGAIGVIMQEFRAFRDEQKRKEGVK